MGGWSRIVETFAATLLMAQAAPPQTVDPAFEQQPPTDDVVVTGLRDLNDPDSAVTRQTLGSGRVGVSAQRSRQVFELAQRFARCAMKPGSADRRALRQALDGVVNGAGQRFWQSRYIMQRSACSQDPGIARSVGVAVSFGTGNYDTSYYERGALYIRAIELFAPDLHLTAKETGDPQVQARFNARETPLERFRLPADRQYFEIAICLVRMQPELSVRLVGTDKADAIARLEAAIVNRAKPCVRNARKVYFDQSQFRFYIADAVYRWAIAVRGVDSLIPAA